MSLAVSSAARVQDNASFVKYVFSSRSLSTSAKRTHSAARFRHWCPRCACQSNYCHQTLRSLPSCRARSRSHLGVFRSRSHFGSGIETMAGTNLIRLVAGRCSYPQACIVVCNVPAIVIHGSFPVRTAMAKKGRRLIRWSKTDHAELKRHSRSKTPVVKVAKAMKRTERSIRQKAASLGFPIGHQR